MKKTIAALLLAIATAGLGPLVSANQTMASYQADYTSGSADLAIIAGIAELEVRLDIGETRGVLYVTAVGVSDVVDISVCRQGDGFLIADEDDTQCSTPTAEFSQGADHIICETCDDETMPRFWGRI
ncbi:hypothetical protein [Thioalkalivibrio thiocyanodenitrificans]|uniref:hypothetical protein n=1 Tax=Thioalkalivibrio thiocyanodenitrificans TaxID=243063 RepID=UPI00035CFB75|nr:hypothetical protein [Thioalkalivibrio thiocyanodenitrificans]